MISCWPPEWTIPHVSPLWSYPGFFFVRNPVPSTHAKCRKNEFWAFVKWVFGFFQADLVNFYKNVDLFINYPKQNGKICPIFWYFEWICVTFEDKWGKTNENAIFFGFETRVLLLVKWVLPSVKWVLPSVKWVLPSVKWVSAFLGEMSFRQNAQKKPALRSDFWTTRAFQILSTI